MKDGCFLFQGVHYFTFPRHKSLKSQFPKRVLDTVAEHHFSLNRRSHKPFAISVIIPTYNRADLLFHCLGALESQQLPPSESFEVIVVDDSSTDGTPTRVREWNSKCELRMISQTQV